MSILWIYYDKLCYCHSLSIEEQEEITIGNNLKHTISLRSFPLDSAISIQTIDNERRLQITYEGNVLGEVQNQTPLEVKIDASLFKFLLDVSPQKEKHYYLGNQTEIHIPVANHSEDHKSTCFSLIKVKDQWILQPNHKEIYINGHQMKDMYELQLGDVVYYPSATMVLIENDVMMVKGNKASKLPLSPVKLPTSVLKEKYPNYRRTPRMIYDLPEEKVNFSFPDREAENNQRGLWIMVLPPLVMLIVMGVITMIRPRGIFILMSIAIFTMTIITSSVQYFKERKRVKEKNIKRKELYTKYLKDKQMELQKLYDKQRDVLYYHFPSFERMKYLTSEISDQIWERTITSHDFLHIRVGRAMVPASYDVSSQRTEMTNRELDDLLEKSQELIRHFKEVKNVPLTIDLFTGSTGMIGKETIVKREIRQIIGQLAFFHSYHDVRFVAIFNEDEYEEWEWVKWLPHFRLPHVYARGLIYNEQTRDQLLSSIFELLKERELDEEKDKKRFIPHFVFIITNRQLISEHSILSFLESGDQEEIGITTIFAADRKESLSENINTLVRYNDDKHGDILIQNHKAKHTPFELDPHTTTGNESFARTLFSLNHELGMSDSIPDKVTFMELFETDEVKELEIQKRWAENKSSKSLAVPIGLKSKDDLVYLNLHEKAHGPHGLLAGTTGSGKSEFLQTYILSLAVHFHPYEVAFLLIDYKGGGMAQPFKNIPHLLGTITNIEGSKNFSKRALESIKSELKHRQRLFDQFEVNHINDYMDLYKENVANEPLPHLFLISDEFAELKSEEPEFIKELVSAARIGRSLGVHLILATQKPGGIIDNQIWSNSRFKVALKVQDESDSKEILKNGDAAHITVTGRGYLQVGNNEVYELFQSAWSGAPYEKNIVSTEDEVALVTDLGFVPLSEVATEDDTRKSKETEIDVVVEEIAKVTDELQIKKVPSPWLPPLPNRIIAKEDKTNQPNQFMIALTDEPELQQQNQYLYKAVEDGNIGIFGSAGYGKSMTILTILLSMARKHSPEKYQFYIFDFGNGALLPLKNLPHTGDYFQTDDLRKIEKFFNMIHKEMNKRKELFQEYVVNNIALYNEVAPEKLPIIFVTVDNFDIIRDEMIDLESEFIQLSRDGQSLGIYLILSATRNGAVKHALMGNLKTRILHYLMDAGEKTVIIGKTPYEIEAIPGRAYIKKEDAFLSQIVLPIEGQTDVEMLENMKHEVEVLQARYQDAKKPFSIPMLPNKLNFITFTKKYELKQTPTKFAIGLDEGSVQPVYIDFDKHKQLIVMGDAGKGKTNILQLIIHQMLTNAETKIGLFDSIQHTLSDYSDEKQIDYIETKDKFSKWIEDVEEELERRDNAYREVISGKRDAALKFPPLMLMVDEVGYFKQNINKADETKLIHMIKNKTHLGFCFVVTGSANDVAKGFDPLTSQMKQIKQVILLMRKSDQSFVHLPYVRNESELKQGFAYYVLNNSDRKILIPEYNLERASSTI